MSVLFFALSEAVIEEEGEPKFTQSIIRKGGEKGKIASPYPLIGIFWRGIHEGRGNPLSSFWGKKALSNSS